MKARHMNPLEGYLDLSTLGDQAELARRIRGAIDNDRLSDDAQLKEAIGVWCRAPWSANKRLANYAMSITRRHRHNDAEKTTWSLLKNPNGRCKDAPTRGARAILWGEYRHLVTTRDPTGDRFVNHLSPSGLICAGALLAHYQRCPACYETARASLVIDAFEQEESNRRFNNR